MKVEQKKFSKTHGWETLKETGFDAANCNFVMAFGCNSILEDEAIYKTIRNSYPNADVIMSSTSGEIYDVQVNDDTVSLTAVCFDSTIIKTASVKIDEVKNSREAGRFLASSLDPENLKNVLIISDDIKRGMYTSTVFFIRGI